MKYLLALTLIIMSLSANAQLLDDGLGYNEFRHITGDKADWSAAGSLTTTYTFLDTSKRTLETVGLRCMYCNSDSEISNEYLTLHGDVKGTTLLYKSTALRYKNTQWVPSAASIDGIVFTSSNLAYLTEVANTSIPNIPGARMRVVIFPITGSPITTPFVDFIPNGRTIIPTGNVQTSNIFEIHIEFWNFNRVRTQFKVETLDAASTTPICQ